MDSPSKHLLEISKAVEFEKRLKLPKFSHAHMACINPIHKERKSESPPKADRIKWVGSPVRMGKKEHLTKILPDHLIRPPVDVMTEPVHKERTIGDLIRVKEMKLGKKLTAMEKKEIIEKERKRQEQQKHLEEIKTKSKIFFKECQLRLDEINSKQEIERNTSTGALAKKSIIASLFTTEIKGIRKLFYELMNTKMEKITRPKFLEFAQKVLDKQKLTDTEIKELFNLYCKKNKKEKPKVSNFKVSIQYCDIHCRMYFYRYIYSCLFASIIASLKF